MLACSIPAVGQTLPIPDANQPNVFYGDVKAGSENGPVLVFVHGVGATAASWWTTPNDAYLRAFNAGYRTAFVSLSKDNTPNIADPTVNAPVFAAAIPSIVTHYNTPYVYVIAHSKGGIDVQAAMLSPTIAFYIKAVFMIATPNQGTELANWAAGPGRPQATALGLYNPAVLSMQTTVVATQIRPLLDPASTVAGVPFFTIAGTSATTPPNPLTVQTGPVLSALTGGQPNDGIVTVPRTKLPATYASDLGTIPANHFAIAIGSFSFPRIDAQIKLMEGTAPFDRIATNGFALDGNGNPIDDPANQASDRQNSFPWSTQWFKGRLYVGTGRAFMCVTNATADVAVGSHTYPPPYPDIECTPDPKDLPLRAEIWRYTPREHTWQRVYQSPMDVPIEFDANGKPTKFTARDIAFRGMAVFEENDVKSINLNLWTSPDNGVAGVNNINVTASGFPAGTINPVNVIATFSTSCGGAVLATAPANSIKTVLGSVKRVNVSIPAARATGIYYVQLSDTAVGDANFHSNDCSQVNVSGTGIRVATVEDKDPNSDPNMAEVERRKQEAQKREQSQRLYVGGISASSLYEKLPAYADPAVRRFPPPRILWTDEGTDWHEVPQKAGTFLGDVNIQTEAVNKRGFRSFATLRDANGVNRLFATLSDLRGVGRLIMSSNPSAGNDAWRQVSPGADEFPIFTIYAYRNQIYVTATLGSNANPAGYGVFRTDAATPNVTNRSWFKFEPVALPGLLQLAAFRPNGAISMQEFRGSLFVGSDRPTELIRINPDDTWDLIVGQPRLTTTGFKKPLSGLGKGFNSMFNGHFYSMAVNNGQLYLGTWDWSQMLRGTVADGIFNRNYGFDLFKSADGEHWNVVSRDGLKDPLNSSVRNLESTPMGLYLGATNPYFGLQIFQNQATLDLNRDGIINQPDVDIIRAAVDTLATGPDDPRDLDRDGVIDDADVRLLASQCLFERCALVAGEHDGPRPTLHQPGPTSLVADGTRSHVRLRWMPVESALQYHIYRSDSVALTDLVPPTL
ncbi:MAG TPA: hypothetical protein VM165_08495, partial [Planctomycetaceae bacterium]|nr:hypothetical protein [Planctomycetaceae bacterium]